MERMGGRLGALQKDDIGLDMLFCPTGAKMIVASCCGSRHLRRRQSLPHLPTAATRSGRFIRRWRRSHRSPVSELVSATCHRHVALLRVRVLSSAKKKKRPHRRAASHRDLYAPKRIFSRNTALKSNGRRQPCRDFFLCLAEKSHFLECFAVLKQRFFLTRASRGRRNTLCISRTMVLLWGKRLIQNRMNPYGRPPNGVVSFLVCVFL